MIELRNVTIHAGDFQLSDLSFQVPAGSYAVLMGRTGRGKTTILEAICGLRAISAGRVLIDGEDVTDWLPGDRQVGYVPQDLALFPTLTVAEHLAFALKLRGYARDAMKSRTVELADVLGITPLLDRGVTALSGGEAQRVALGRAISFDPSVLLLDEPLSALDESTRGEMHELLKRVKEATNVTILHVTHNTEEANVLADCTLILEEGRVALASRR